MGRSPQSPLRRPRPPLHALSQLRSDPARLSDAEIVVLLLASKSIGLPLSSAARIVGEAGLGVLRDASVEDVAKNFDVGRVGAERLALSVELGRRVYGIGAEGPVFQSPEAVYVQNRDLAEEGREHFATLLLNARHRIIKREIISIGSLSASIVHPREVFRPAIQEGSAAIVLVHNHPSGDPTPSRDDVEITRRLVRAGNLIGIEVLDHVIVSLAAYRSLRREGLMDASDASGFAG